MRQERFWKIIEESRRDFRPVAPDEENKARQILNLERSLSLLQPDEMLTFRNLFYDLMDDAFTWNLWGAAHVILDGCSDDDFEYFRRWLVSMGQQVYEDALRKADTLGGSVAEPGVGSASFESFLWVADDVYENLTGREAPDYAGEAPKRWCARGRYATVRSGRLGRYGVAGVQTRAATSLLPRDAIGTSHPLWNG